MKWVWVLLLLAACSSLNLQSIVDKNPNAVVTINKISEENLDLLKRNVENFCEPITETEVYRVQISENEKTLTKLFTTTGKLLCEIDTSDPEFASKSIAILVNNEPIYLSDVIAVFNSIPQELRAQNTNQAILNLIDNMLLLQEANKQGITVSNEEIDSVLQQNEAALSQLDADVIKEALENRIKIQKVVANVLEGEELQVPESDLREYYNTNKDQLVLPSIFQVRHIQINIGEDEETALQKSTTIIGLLETTDFCDLVKQFSDDTDSKNSCGAYTFQSGQMNSNVEASLKQMQINEARIVRSDETYHIINLLEATEPRGVAYGEVRDGIKDLLELQKRQQIVQDYLDSLREEAEIISYIN